MPFYAATDRRSRMAPQARPQRLALVLCWQVATLLLAVVGQAAEERTRARAGGPPPSVRQRSTPQPAARCSTGAG
jgi:hypothetical protein